MVKFLLDAGADQEHKTDEMHTALMEASMDGHVEVARLLLDSGAQVYCLNSCILCDMKEFSIGLGVVMGFRTCIYEKAVLTLLFLNSAPLLPLQVNMPADSFESPLTLAACGGHTDLALLLLERGANIEEVNDEGYTPLMEAAREGHEEMVTLLLAHGWSSLYCFPFASLLM